MFVVVVIGTGSHPIIGIVILSPYSLSIPRWRRMLCIKDSLTRSYAWIWVRWTTLRDRKSFTLGQNHLPSWFKWDWDKPGFIELPDVWSVKFHWDGVDLSLFGVGVFECWSCSVWFFFFAFTTMSGSTEVGTPDGFALRRSKPSIMTRNNHIYFVRRMSEWKILNQMYHFHLILL